MRDRLNPLTLSHTCFAAKEGRWALPNVLAELRARPMNANEASMPKIARQFRDRQTPARYLNRPACRISTAPIPDALPQLLGKPDEEPFGAADVAEPIRVFVLNDFADELRAPFAQPDERLVDVAHSEHDA